ncbi:SCO family protein [Flavobacterium okayamense]|uniref:Photosynthetic protein synthase II n=1 Tax=Flavobacterium okayamense TaxID=2830782 RepID=A0ABM7S9Y8_9FLAO|nr:SCO family protein [Flavobacterium okayamense]BCY28159.1 photosynthetic protein synthase II [Flavobacterium okayamense]
MKKSYIGLAFIILIFGIWVVKEINARYYSKSDLFEIGSAPRFELTNQDGKIVTDQDYLGKVYVLEFFFSTCPTICPKMNQNMLKLQDEFGGNENFGIASITINPENDSPEVLKEHAKHLGVTMNSWNMLTGDRNYIYDLSNKGFNLYAKENKNVSGGFEHSGLFALIDKEGNIRCRKDEFGNPILYYDGIEESGIKAIKEDIKILLEE